LKLQNFGLATLALSYVKLIKNHAFSRKVLGGDLFCSPGGDLLKKDFTPGCAVSLCSRRRPFEKETCHKKIVCEGSKIEIQ
jgi:hypothetical protein